MTICCTGVSSAPLNKNSDYLDGIFENADLDPDDTVQFKQWSLESHGIISDMSLSVSDFIIRALD